jgi:hypothetical protein
MNSQITMMPENTPSQLPYPGLFRLARAAALLVGLLLSFLAIYDWIAILLQVAQQPSLISPDVDLWSAALLETALAGMGLPGSFFAFYALFFTLMFDLAFLACGWLILWRKNRDWFGLYLGLILLIWADGAGVFYHTPTVSTWLETIKPFLAWIGWPGLFVILVVCPSGHVTPRWARFFAAGLGILIVYGLIISVLQIDPFSFVIAMPLIMICLLVGGYAQVYRYRHAGLSERQQIKWVVFALVFYVLFFILMTVLLNVILIDDPVRFKPSTALIASILLLTVGSLVFMGLPISIVMAVLRYNLWDIDVIIRKALVYGVLTVTLALLYFGIITILQALSTSIFGPQSPIVIVLTTLAIAALFNPLRLRIQSTIDRRFYRNKYNAEKALANFAIAARNETDIECLNSALLEVVQDTMQPENASVWLLATHKTSNRLL